MWCNSQQFLVRSCGGINYAAVYKPIVKPRQALLSDGRTKLYLAVATNRNRCSSMASSVEIPAVFLSQERMKQMKPPPPRHVTFPGHRSPPAAYLFRPHCLQMYEKPRIHCQDILAGDDEEHAILLHNYILHLIMVKEGISGANRRPPGRSGLRTEVRPRRRGRGGVGRGWLRKTVTCHITT